MDDSGIESKPRDQRAPFTERVDSNNWFKISEEREQAAVQASQADEEAAANQQRFHDAYVAPLNNLAQQTEIGAIQTLLQHAWAEGARFPQYASQWPVWQQNAQARIAQLEQEAAELDSAAVAADALRHAPAAFEGPIPAVPKRKASRQDVSGSSGDSVQDTEQRERLAQQAAAFRKTSKTGLP